MELTSEKLEVIKVIFNNYKEETEEVWKIKVNGNFLKTHKGKSTWSREHFARRALVNFVENNYLIRRILPNKWHTNSEEINDLVKQLENAKVVEFVRVV